MVWVHPFAGVIYEPECLTLHKIPTPMAVFEYVMWRMVWFANRCDPT